MSNIDKTVGSNIKRIRKRSGLTQEHVAQYLGIDQTLVSKIESGQRSVGVSSLEALCDLFFCTLDDFLDAATTAPVEKAVAFRAESLGTDDLQAIAAIGRIARNLEEMAALEKRASREA